MLSRVSGAQLKLHIPDVTLLYEYSVYGRKEAT